MRSAVLTPLLVAGAVSVLIAGCTAIRAPEPTEPAPEPTPEPVVLTADCVAALAHLQAVEPGDSEVEHEAIFVSTTACTTVEEYLLGVEDNPASWWYSDAKFVRENAEILILSACHDAPPAPMCEDAERLGYDLG